LIKEKVSGVLKMEPGVEGRFFVKLNSKGLTSEKLPNSGMEKLPPHSNTKRVGVGTGRESSTIADMMK
jgi:hypothetical protein